MAFIVNPMPRGYNCTQCNNFQLVDAGPPVTGQCRFQAPSPLDPPGTYPPPIVDPVTFWCGKWSPANPPLTGLPTR